MLFWRLQTLDGAVLGVFPPQQGWPMVPHPPQLERPMHCRFWKPQLPPFIMHMPGTPLAELMQQPPPPHARPLQHG